MEYTYNLSGAMVEQKYPSGRIVKTVLDSEGDLQTVKSQKNANNAFWNYANHFTYTAAGMVSSMQLGNGTWEKTAFNSRLQPTQIALGKVQNTSDLLKLDYTYGVVESGTLNTAKNNGNIQSQSITVPNITGANGFTAVQTYSYDSLNRIEDATEMVTPAGSSTATQSWKQDYTFDRYGNRNFIEANTTTIPRNCLDNQTPPNLTVCDEDRKAFNPNVNASNNRLSSSDGYQFDAAGNTIRDPQFRKFTYDAENKQTKVETVDANGTVTGTLGQYSYDGDGRRVRKIAWINGQWETTVFVYDASSRLVAEYSTILNPTPQVAYLTNDYLGSPRINTDENGSVIARHDYRPYGEEIAERTHSQYAADTIRKQFTAYERDRETDLDFAQARYFRAILGRFDSADYVAAAPFTPASFNRYHYGLGNPLRFVDVTGGYDEEVHRDLTVLLAFAAGFTQKQAEAIGNATQWPDDPRSGADPEQLGRAGVEARRRYHFTDTAVRNGHWKNFEELATAGSGDVYSAIGTFLHAEQDSFSHEKFGPELGQVIGAFDNFSILSSSGNSMEEEARKYDRTTSDPDKAVRMARDTLGYLLKAIARLEQSGKYGKFAKPVDFSKFESEMREWARADSREKKAAVLKRIRTIIIDSRKEDEPDKPKRKKRTKTSVRVLPD